MADAPATVAPAQPVPAVAPAATLNLPTGMVSSIADGDTLRMAYQGKLVTVRLACVDAPEISQVPYGLAAANRLRELLPRTTVVRFREVDRDRYGRLVAEVYAPEAPTQGSTPALSPGLSVNLQLVKEGQAVVYRQYLSACPESRAVLLQAEGQARQARLNFWNQPNPLMPWDYRQGLTTSPPLPDPTAPVPLREPQRGRCDCPYDVDNAGRTCGDRSSYSRSGGSNQRICYVGDGP
ncbi:MAG: thermonuclease family protein [Cyanobacteria bacterium REEB459]|nr:thermonuclease family protein [Cyanobacteria bacterium REEB459]